MPPLEEAVEESATKNLLLHSLHLLWLSEARLLAGRRGEALELAQRGLAAARDRKERGHQAWGLRLLGEIACHGEPPQVEDGETRYRAAITLAGQLGMRPLLAHCHLGLGKLYRCTGQSAQAQEHLTTATAMYREMDMPFWREKAEAEITVSG